MTGAASGAAHASARRAGDGLAGEADAPTCATPCAIDVPGCTRLASDAAVGAVKVAPWLWRAGVAGAERGRVAARCLYPTPRPSIKRLMLEGAVGNADVLAATLAMWRAAVSISTSRSA